MQFALPPRKPSHHVPYTRLSHSSIARRRKLKAGAILAFIAFSFLFLFSRLFSPSSLPVSSGEVVPAGVTNIVIVTVLDEDSLSDKYIQRIKQNREDYAKRHGKINAKHLLAVNGSLLIRDKIKKKTGYTNFFASTKEYLPYLNGAPRSWTLIPALRHAYTLYPKASHFFHLSPHAVIMNPSLSLTSHILDNNRLESLMIKEKSVVPPDSVIKTFAHLKAKDVDLIISQDAENLCPGSFILRRTDWTRYFLDVWFDPLYRSYNFAKAEIHALVRFHIAIYISI